MRNRAATGADAGAGGLVLGACLVLVTAATAGDAVTSRDVTFGSVEVLAVACTALLLDTRRLALVTGWAWLGQAGCVAVGSISVETAALDALSTAVAATLIAVVAHARHRRDAPAERVGVAALPVRAEAGPALAGPPSLAAALSLRGLTSRECEVVTLALSGFTASQIGERLFIGRRTVETHLGRAYSKFGVHSRAGIAEAIFSAPH